MKVFLKFVQSQNQQQHCGGTNSFEIKMIKKILHLSFNILYVYQFLLMNRISMKEIRYRIFSDEIKVQKVFHTFKDICRIRFGSGSGYSHPDPVRVRVYSDRVRFGPGRKKKSRFDFGYKKMHPCRTLFQIDHKFVFYLRSTRTYYLTYSKKKVSQ